MLDADCGGVDDPTLDLSAAARHGNTLFLGSDEGVCLERLSRGAAAWADHQRFPLDAILDLDASEEADIEGLAEDGGWLWVLGSHARTRPKVGKADNDHIDLSAFATLKDTRPRCLLARVPLAVDPNIPATMRPVRLDGERRAGMVRQTKHGNRLAHMMKDSALLKPFTRIAAKEGGVDLEGIAVAGGRVAIGMRGPVIQTYAVLLEVEIVPKPSGRLTIAGQLHMRLLELDGLGIRDLKRDGADLLILAGPTTGLDGPCAIYRWADWLGDPPRDYTVVRRHRPERIIDLPFGRGDDHPEGLVLLDGINGERDVLVICDSPAASRLDPATRSVRCDRFRMPIKQRGLQKAGDPSSDRLR
ncbi:DUF3616 domain-containing protein [Sphingomonas qomolangmaensis]|uniref:DUF3616 domain-containing protein n=1 Tax=Sphingomonas qomolangmaensis TaxID=2918765 RepID=A0ABY5LEA7_9SPHN|nr:DUF3616 domain-containing protein [Sphingomonas qomolangmaensis]UUL84074.1 DUF3616 domain-containing protein [Sphingomonas qomolangmaensis]